MATLPTTYRPVLPPELRPAPAATLALIDKFSPVKASPWAFTAPLLGMAGAALLMLLPRFGIGEAGAVFAAFCLGVAALYLALIPTCVRGGVAALLMAVGNTTAGLMLVDWPSALHGWLSLQTVVAALWLLRDQNAGTRALAGLLLGLNAGAVAALGFALTS